MDSRVIGYPMAKQLVVAALVVFFSADALAESREKPKTFATYSVPLGDSPAIGASDALVTMVYACDYSGPYCEKIRKTVAELLEVYPDELEVVHKHFVVFPNKSKLPALAACAAHQQGKFWEMDEALWRLGFRRYNKNYSSRNLEQIARDAGLNMSKYKSAMAKSGKCARIIADEKESMERVGVQGVPASYINGRWLPGAVSVQEFERLIDEELGKARKRVGRSRAKIRSYYNTWVVKKGIKETKSRAAELAKTRPDPKATYAFPIGSSPTRGPSDAKITMVVACQFTGQYCKRVRPTIEKLAKRYGDDFRLVAKHFVVHITEATKPALAACAAHQQGKYWAMENLLWGPMYDDGDFSDTRLRSAAQAIGLDMKRYDRDIAGVCPSIVKQEQAEAEKLGTSGTPSSYINGRHVPGAVAYEDFDKVVKEELRKAKRRLGRKSGKNYYRDWVERKGVKKFAPEK